MEDTRHLIPDPSIICSTIRKRYLQFVAMSERTAPVVEVAMYVRVTQHDGNLHPHSAASSVVNMQDAKMEPQPVLHMYAHLRRPSTRYRGTYFRSDRLTTVDGGLLSALEPC